MVAIYEIIVYILTYGFKSHIWLNKNDIWRNVMNIEAEIRQGVRAYFEAKINKYVERTEKEDIEKITFKQARKQVKEFASEYANDKFIANTGEFIGVVTGFTVAGLIGFLELGVGALVTIPVGVSIGGIAGKYIASVTAGGVGAGVKSVKVGAECAQQKYQQRKIDRAKKIYPQLRDNVDGLIGEFSENQDLVDKIIDLKNRGKEQRVNNIYKEFYRIVKQQALKEEVDCEIAVAKLVKKNKIQVANQISLERQNVSNKLAQISIFAANPSQEPQEVDNEKNAISYT